MKNRWRIILTAAWLAMFWGCEKKPLPETAPDQPDFYFKARINGENVDALAGENGYYMHPSHFLDTNKVYVLKAELSQSSCGSNCGYGITVLLNDKVMSESSQTIDISRALQNGTYVYFDKSLPPIYYRAHLKPLRNQSSNEVYTWNLNGNSIQGYTASAIVESGKLFFPMLVYSDGSGNCNASLQKQYKVGSALQVEVVAQKEGPFDVLMYSFNAQTNSSGPYQYLWQFGDGTSSTSERPFHTYQHQGFYSTKLTLIKNAKDTCYSFFQVPAFFDPGCEANFSAAFEALPNTKGYGGITVLLQDKEGRVFSSRGLAQPQYSYFELLEQSEYRANDKLEPTKKIKVRFSCRVENNGQFIDIQDAEAVLAVSY